MNPELRDGSIFCPLTQQRLPQRAPWTRGEALHWGWGSSAGRRDQAHSASPACRGAASPGTAPEQQGPSPHPGFLWGLRHGRVDSEGTAGPGASLPWAGPHGRTGRGREMQRWFLEGGKDHRKWFESGEKIFQHSQMLTLGREKEPISEKLYVLCFLQSFWNRKQLV